MNWESNSFREVYSGLYNSARSDEEMAEIQKKIIELVRTEDSRKEIEKLTPEIVKKAATLMKPKKMDVSQGFSSECILHAPDLMFNLLSLIFQDWLRHGTVTLSVLACAFIPLLKNSLKDPALTDSYRAIAGSALLLKLFESCILLVWGDRLHSDTLQFGFKKGCGTSTATWLVQKLPQQFLRGGSKPVAVVLDCSKAFDKAKFLILFHLLLEEDRKVPAVVVRILAFSYQEQVAWVHWGRQCTSSTFRISNGTRQGSVASPAFWSVYVDPFFRELREGGVGCHIVGIFVGVIGCADDIILLAPNRRSAQRMLSVCELFA